MPEEEKRPEGEKPEDDPKPEDEKPEGEPDDDAEEFDAERAKATIAAQRKAERDAKAEARKARQDLEAANARLKELEDAEKSELDKANERAERAERERDDAKAKAKQQALRSAFFAEAMKQQVSNFDLGWRALDEEVVEYDDEGNPSNVADLVKQLLVDYPELKKTNGRGVDPTPDPDNRGVAESVKQEARAATEARTRRWL